MTRTRRPWLVHVLAIPGLLCLAALIGVAVGFGEDRVFILGIGPLLVGVASGVTAGFHLYFTRPGSRQAIAFILIGASLAGVMGLHLGRLQVDRDAFERVYIEATQEGFIRQGDAEILASPEQDSDLERAWAEHLEDEAGRSGVLGHLQMRAEMGVRVLGSRGLETPAWVSWSAWVLEWGLAWLTVWTVTAGVRRRITDPPITVPGS